MEKDIKIYNFLKQIDFRCQRCSNCCRIEPGAVFLTREDVKRISEYLNLSIKEFTGEYCRTLVKKNKILIGLKEKINFDCIFWDQKCLIYKVRPVQCTTYPFWPSIVESKDSWDKESKRCIGINKKSNLTIEEKYDLYTQEKNVEYMEIK